MEVLRRRPVSITILDPSEVGEAVLAQLALDERVLVRVVVPRHGAEVALGQLIASRADIVVLDAAATLGRGWRAERLIAPLLACGTEVVARGPGAGDRRCAVPRGAPASAVVEAVRSLYPQLRGRPGPPLAIER